MRAIRFKTLAAAALTAVAMGAQAAPAVLDTGVVSMGLFDHAGLGALGVGFRGPNDPDSGGDSITRGCLCEGWGAAASGTSGYSYGGGTSGITSSNLVAPDTSGADLSATSTVTMSNGLQVVHSYSSAAGGSLFRVAITLTNTTAGTLTDVRYARTLDWDINPGYFGSNYTTVYGGTPAGPGGKVLHTSTDPFAVPNPMVFRSQEANTNVFLTPGDKGGYFVFGFGDLDAGESLSFDTYIGADRTISGLLGALASVGVEAYSYTAGSTLLTDGSRSPAYGYGFVGLGLPPVFGTPEPASMALVGLALLGAGVGRRRRA